MFGRGFDDGDALALPLSLWHLVNAALDDTLGTDVCVAPGEQQVQFLGLAGGQFVLAGHVLVAVSVFGYGGRVGLVVLPSAYATLGVLDAVWVLKPHEVPLFR